MERLESGEGFLAIAIDPDVGTAEEKPVLQSGQVGERGEGFDKRGIGHGRPPNSPSTEESTRHAAGLGHLLPVRET